MTKLLKHAVLILALVAVTMSTSVAGTFAGKTRLELGVGWRHNPGRTGNLVYVDNDPFVSASDGAVGRLSLSHWGSDDMAFALDYTIHDVETGSEVDAYGTLYDSTTIVHSLMFGFRFYMPQSGAYTAMQPYFSVAGGPFIGTTEYNSPEDCGCDTYTEVHHVVVPAARLGGGIDFQMSPHLMLGFYGGYNFVEEFSEPIGGRYDYSGSDFGMSVSLLFGGRHGDGHTGGHAGGRRIKRL